MFNIVVLGIVSFLTDISTEMIYPLIPIFLSTTLGASPAIVGVIEGIAESLASLLKVFSGYWGDKTKKKKELAIAGYGSSLLGKVVLIRLGINRSRLKQRKNILIFFDVRHILNIENIRFEVLK